MLKVLWNIRVKKGKIVTETIWLKKMFQNGKPKREKKKFLNNFKGQI